MRIEIYASFEEHLEDREELQRENDLRRARGQATRNAVVEPPRLVNWPRYSFEPFAPDQTPHLVMTCPDWYELTKTSGGWIGLFPNTPEGRAARALSAWDCVEAAKARRFALAVVEPPLRAELHVAYVEAGGSSGRVFGFTPAPAFAGEGVRVIPGRTLAVVGPTGAKVVETGSGKAVAVPVGNGSYRNLTALEVADLAVRRAGGFVEAEAV